MFTDLLFMPSSINESFQIGDGAFTLFEPGVTSQVEDSELRNQSVPIGSITGFDRNKSDSDKN